MLLLLLLVRRRRGWLAASTFDDDGRKNFSLFDSSARWDSTFGLFFSFTQLFFQAVACKYMCMYVYLYVPGFAVRTITRIKQPNSKRQYACKYWTNQKKRKPLITLLSLDFFFFLRASTSLPTEHLCINTEFGSFSSQEITTTWKSGARTDTCDCCCCLLLFTLFSILLARTRPAAGSGRGVPDWRFYPRIGAGKVALSAATLPCWFVSVVVVAAAASADVVFIFIIFSRTLVYSSLLCFSRADPDSSALSLVTFSSPSPRGTSSYYSTSLFHLLNHSLFAAAATSAVSYTWVFQLFNLHTIALAGCSIEKITSPIS